MLYAFAEYELDERLFELRRSGQRLSVPPKVLDLLLYLVRNRQRVVAKEELLTNVWSGVAVTEDSLSQAVRSARRVLLDDAGEPRFIETLRGRGYHFAAPVVSRASERPQVSITAQDAAPPSSSWSALSERDTFVGRAELLARLDRLAEESFSGKGRAVLVRGEPGIGKTRLIDRFALQAAGVGAEVLVARCYEGEGAPAYWPWTQVLRSCFEARPSAEALRAVIPNTAEFAPLLPEVARAGGPEAKPSTETAQDRFALFESVNRLLRRLSKHRPVLVVIDDLHDADEPSLLLFQFLLRQISQQRVLLMSTARETPRTQPSLLERIVSDMTQVSPRSVIRLAGLSSNEIASFVEQTTRKRPSPSCLAALVEQTGGNPLFLMHLLQVLVQEGRLGDLERDRSPTMPAPRSLQDGIRRHLDGLTEECKAALRIAAVFGREFDVAALARAAKQPPEALLGNLAQAESRGLIELRPGPMARYRFVHALIRDVLYGSLDILARVRLHADVGQALVDLTGDLGPERLPEIAHHFAEAAAGGHVARALDYCERAAQDAISRMAHEQAQVLYERALEVLALGPSDPARQLDLLLGLGFAELRSGKLTRARASYERATQLAKSLGDALAFADAVLGYCSEDETGDVVEARVALLEEALDGLGDEHAATRAKLLGRLALALYFSKDLARSSELAESAVSVARQSGDARALAQSLRNQHFVLWLPEHAERRLAMGAELLELAESSGSRELEALSIAARIEDCLALGELQKLEADMARYARIAAEVPHPLHQWYTLLHGGMRAHLQGDFEAAEHAIFEAFRVAQQARFALSGVWLGVQLFALRREQGRLGELEEPIRNLRAQHPKLLSWRIGAAYLDALAGRRNDAERELRVLTENGLSAIRRDVNWLVNVAVLSEVCAALRDRTVARVLYEALEPYSRLHVTVGLGIAYYGSVARYLGLLAAALERWEDAAAHFERALSEHARLSARPFTAYTEYDYASMLVRRSFPGDADRAAPLLNQTLSLAEALGMQSLAEKCRKLELELSGPATRRL